MVEDISFGQLVKMRRHELGLTQNALAHRVGCALVTLRKIEYGDLRPSVQIAERLAMALNVRMERRTDFMHQARIERHPFFEVTPTPLPRVKKSENGDFDMNTFPSGTITFLFTDIEGSTRLWQEQPEQMRTNLIHHSRILHTAIEQNGGYVFKTMGDSFCAAFSTALEGLHAAIEAQQVLAQADWGQACIRVRMGLHTGDAEERDNDYFGNTLNRVARLMAAGHGGQVLLSLATQELVRDTLPAGVELRDLGRHRLKDLIRPEQVFQLIIPGLLQDFPPLKTLDYHPNNLPIQNTPFIGREQELQELKASLVNPTTRLITLTGVGGTGKTRLALQAAAEMLDEFPDGVYFVALESLTKMDQVILAIAQALDVKNPLGNPLDEVVKGYLNEKKLLLVLDNMEQVAQAASVVGDLLNTTQNIHILATSRTLLRVYGEYDFAVPPLKIPDVRRLPQLEQLTQYEAVRLFIQRAQAVRADFAVNDQNAPAVAEICHRLEGLPLAIELAAARVRTFNPEKIVSQLEQQLKFLIGGARNLPARQQTLRNTIDWSYSLLDAAEQALFQDLSVFVGGATMDAIEAVCSHPSDVDIFSLMEQLLDKSLVKLVEVEEQVRYSMLDVLREYALEKLADSGRDADTHKRQLVFFNNLSQEIQPQLATYQAPQRLAQMDVEYGNLQAALTWAADHDLETALDLFCALHSFWQYRHQHDKECSFWTKRLFSLSEGMRSGARVHVIYAATSNADLSEAEKQHLFEEGLALSNELDYAKGRAIAYLGLSYLFFPKDKTKSPEKSRELMEKALQEFRQINEQVGVASALCGLGQLSLWANDFLAARAWYDEGLAASQKSGDLRHMAALTNNLGIVAWNLGDIEKAQQYYEKAASLAQEVGDHWSWVMYLSNCADAAMGRDDHITAISLLEDALAICRQYNFYVQWPLLYTLNGLGQAHHQLRNYGQATQYYEEAISLALKFVPHNTDFILGSYLGLGMIANAQNQIQTAKQHFRAMFALLSPELISQDEFQNWPGRCVLGVAHLVDRLGKQALASQLLGAAAAWDQPLPTSYQGIEADKDFIRLKENLLQALGTDTFQSAWEYGQTLTEVQGMAQALDICQE